MRSRFDRELEKLHQELTKVGELCEEAISASVLALLEDDQAMAETARARERDIDQQERNVESLCMKLLLQQQPVARDLRQISAAMKIITDMERIGDQAADIAEIILAMLSQGYVPGDVGHIREMAAEVIKMVTESVDSYVQKDTVRARLVIAHDDMVDKCFDRVKQVLIVKIAENPACGEHALDLLMIDKYLERIGDHAVSIAEWVIFSVTGSKKR